MAHISAFVYLYTLRAALFTLHIFPVLDIRNMGSGKYSKRAQAFLLSLLDFWGNATILNFFLPIMTPAPNKRNACIY
jgi:hypothetical protein